MKAFFREPVFVDPTGRRSRTLRRAGVLVVAPTSAYLLLMVSSVLGGPTIDTPLLPPAAADRAPAGASTGAQSVDEEEKAGPVVPTPSQVRVTIGPVIGTGSSPADTAGKPKTSKDTKAGKGEVAPAGKPAAKTTTAAKPTTKAKASGTQSTTTTPKSSKPAGKPAAEPSVEPPATPPSSNPPAAEPPASKPPAKPSNPRPAARPLAPVVAVVTPILDPLVDPVVELVGGVGGLLGLGK